MPRTAAGTSLLRGAGRLPRPGARAARKPVALRGGPQGGRKRATSTSLKAAVRQEPTRMSAVRLSGCTGLSRRAYGARGALGRGVVLRDR